VTTNFLEESTAAATQNPAQPSQRRKQHKENLFVFLFTFYIFVHIVRRGVEGQFLSAAAAISSDQIGASLRKILLG